MLFYCITMQICIEFGDLIGWQAVPIEVYRLTYGPAKGRSGTSNQIYYSWRVIGQISKRSNAEFDLKFGGFQIDHEAWRKISCFKHAIH